MQWYLSQHMNTQEHITDWITDRKQFWIEPDLLPI